MRQMVLLLGMPDLPMVQFVTLIGLALVAALMLGWLADGILGGGGFGIFLNGLLLLAGAIGGAIVWRKLGYSFGASPGLATSIIAAGAAVATLVLAGTIRRLT